MVSLSYESDCFKKRAKWDPLEDLKLVLLRRDGDKWENIAKRLNERTTGASKKRFMVLQKEHGRGIRNMLQGIRRELDDSMLQEFDRHLQAHGLHAAAGAQEG